MRGGYSPVALAPAAEDPQPTPHLFTGATQPHTSIPRPPAVRTSPPPSPPAKWRSATAHSPLVALCWGNAPMTNVELECEESSRGLPASARRRRLTGLSLDPRFDYHPSWGCKRGCGGLDHE